MAEINFSTGLDLTQLEKDLNNARKAVEKLKAEYDRKSAGLSADSDALEKQAEQIEALKQKIAEYRKTLAGGASVGFENYEAAFKALPQAETELAEMEKSFNKALESNIKLGQETEKTAEELRAAEQRAAELAQATEIARGASAGTSQGFKKLGNEIKSAGNRIRGLIKNMFVFSLISGMLRDIKGYFSEVLNQNEELSASVKNLKGAFATLATPIINAVIPALVAIVNWVAKAATAIAQLIGAITGQSLSDMQKAAKTMKKVGGAGKSMAKSLASFDTVQKLGSNSGGGGGGGGGGMFEQAALTNIELAKTLSYIAAIIAALIALKTFGFGTEFLGSLVAIGGALLYVNGFIDAWANGFSLQNIAQMIAGIGVAVAGLAITFGSTGAIIGAVIGAVGLLVLGLKELSDTSAALDAREVEVYGETVESLTRRLEANRKEIENRRVALTEEKSARQSTAEAELATTDALMQKYLELKDVEEPTNEQKALMVQLSKDLINTYPELKDYYDKETGLLNISRDQWEALREAKLKEIQIEAGREKLIELYKLQYEAEDDLKQAVDATQKAQDEYNRVLDEYPGARHLKEAQDLFNAIASGKKDVNNLTEADRELWTEITNGTGHILDAENGIAKLREEMGRNITVVDNARENYSKLGAELIQSKKTYDNVARDTQAFSDNLGRLMTEAAQNATEGFSGGIKNDETMVQSVSEQADNIIDSFRNGLGEHSPSVLFEEAGKDAVAGFNIGWTEGWKNIINNLPSLIGSLNSGLETELNKLVGTVSRAMNNIIDKLNSTGAKINRFSSAVGELSGSSTGISNFRIPRLATGAVIPPNKEFLAVLGDQKSGTNIEAPLDTLVQAFRQAVGEGGQDININFTGSMSQFVAMLDKEITVSRRNRGR